MCNFCVTLLLNIIKFYLKLGFRAFYKLKITGRHNIPKSGAAILICNHQSFLDAPILCAFINREIRFVTWYELFADKFIGFFLKLHRDIPIANKDKGQIDRALELSKEALDEGCMVGIFPEGSLTPDGNIHSFKVGAMWIWERHPCVFVPVAIDGFWDTIFSRKTLTMREKVKLLLNFSRQELRIKIGEPITMTPGSDIKVLENAIRKLHSQIS